MFRRSDRQHPPTPVPPAPPLEAAPPLLTPPAPPPPPITEPPPNPKFDPVWPHAANGVAARKAVSRTSPNNLPRIEFSLNSRLVDRSTPVVATFRLVGTETREHAAAFSDCGISPRASACLVAPSFPRHTGRPPDWPAP